MPVAEWRPAPDRHSVWELLLHAAYWKYIVRRALTKDKAASFPRSPSNFPHPPAARTPAALKKDIALLVDEHRRLREAVAAVPPSRLTRGKPRPVDLILGAAAHDLHHGGQIQLLKRLYAEY